MRLSTVRASSTDPKEAGLLSVLQGSAVVYGVAGHMLEDTQDLQRQGVLLAIASSTVPWEQAVLKPFQPWAEVQPRASSAET